MLLYIDYIRLCEDANHVDTIFRAGLWASNMFFYQHHVGAPS